MKVSCLLLSAALALSGCAHSGEQVPFEEIIAGKAFPSVASEADCSAREGSWQDVSEAAAAASGSFYTCIIPTADAGKSCSSSSQCESLCELAPGQDVEIGEPANGQCMATYSYGGCRSYVHRGLLGSAFCSE
jgi:hypothetical protein